MIKKNARYVEKSGWKLIKQVLKQFIKHLNYDENATLAVFSFFFPLHAHTLKMAMALILAQNY